jgi:hypothetical protein
MQCRAVRGGAGQAVERAGGAGQVGALPAGTVPATVHRARSQIVCVGEG